VFFRAGTLGKALDMFAALFTGTWTSLMPFAANNAYPLLLILVLLGVHRFDDHRRVKLAVRRLRPEFVWSAIVLGWIVAIAVSQGSSSAFIYFDF
jgi:alginate O-acetyltransferase complex protein AlgI